MDQGSAGIVGALVGALATGGGTYLAGRMTDRSHKRQVRREACVSFLHTAEILLIRYEEIEEALCEELAPRRTWTLAEIDQKLAEMESCVEDLRRHKVDIIAECPTDAAVAASWVALKADSILRHASEYRTQHGDNPGGATLDEMNVFSSCQRDFQDHVGKLLARTRELV
jgi:hypothetical protein